LVDRAHDVVVASDVGLVWHENEGLVVTALIAEGECNRARLRNINAMLKKAGIDPAGAGFERLACSVDDAELPLR
jgi:hypothetical protein